MTIPRVIHQIWLGPERRPKTLMDTWRMDGWGYKIWTEKELKGFDFANRALYEWFCDQRIYYGAADVARVEILHDQGGVYVDADSRRLRPIEGPFLDGSFFAVRTNKPPRVANGVMGALPGHPLLADYIRQIQVAPSVMPPYATIGAPTLTQLLDDYADDPTVQILDSFLFYPRSSWGAVHPRCGEALAEHYWASTHGLYGQEDLQWR